MNLKTTWAFVYLTAAVVVAGVMTLAMVPAAVVVSAWQVKRNRQKDKMHDNASK